MIRNFLCHCIVLAYVAIVATGLQFCQNSLDCSTFAMCEDGFCTCVTGYETDYYSSFTNKLYCKLSTAVYIIPIVIPIVVTIIVGIVVSIIIYCILKRRRLARAAQTTWVQSPHVAMGVPVANAQAYPTASYPPPYQQVYPGGYQGYQPNQPVSSGGQPGGQGYPNNPQPNQPLMTNGQTNQGYTQPTQPSGSEFKTS